jgi:hypothetical protein
MLRQSHEQRPNGTASLHLYGSTHVICDSALLKIYELLARAWKHLSPRAFVRPCLRLGIRIRPVNESLWDKKYAEEEKELMKGPNQVVFSDYCGSLVFRHPNSSLPIQESSKKCKRLFNRRQGMYNKVSWIQYDRSSHMWTNTCPMKRNFVLITCSRSVYAN